MILRLVIVCLGVRLGLTAVGLAGDTYSCFSEFESTATNGCKSRVNGADGSYEQETKSEISNMDFCLSGPVYGQAKQGSFGKAKNYVASADLEMTDFDIYSTSYGFLGLAFNMMDSLTYDIVYVRPHTQDFCWELGHVENGLFYGRDFGSCEDKLSKDVNLAVKIEDGKGWIYINGAEMQEFTPFYPSVNKVSSALRNNMVAVMSTSNLQICQGTCSTDYPFPFRNGFYCCKNNVENLDPAGDAGCDGGLLDSNSTCCFEDRWEECSRPPCVSSLVFDDDDDGSEIGNNSKDTDCTEDYPFPFLNGRHCCRYNLDCEGYSIEVHNQCCYNDESRACIEPPCSCYLEFDDVDDPYYDDDDD